MPTLERTALHQSLVRWPAVGVDGYGEPVVGNPEEPFVRCRFDLTVSSSDKGRDSDKTRDATVRTEKPLCVGDLVWQGSLDDLPGTSALVPTSDVFVVTRDESVIDIKGRCTGYEYSLSRYRETLAPSSVPTE